MFKANNEDTRTTRVWRGWGGGIRKPFINYFPDNKYLQKDGDDPYSDFQPF